MLSLNEVEVTAEMYATHTFAWLCAPVVTVGATENRPDGKVTVTSVDEEVPTRPDAEEKARLALLRSVRAVTG